MTVTNFGWGVIFAAFMLAGVLAWRAIAAWEAQRIAWAAAFQDRQVDQNEEERLNWIGANCELMAQNEILNKNITDLKSENDRLKDLMKRVKLIDLKGDEQHE